jgi:hypothetical protein
MSTQPNNAFKKRRAKTHAPQRGRWTLREFMKVSVMASAILSFFGLNASMADPVGEKRTATHSTMEMRAKLLASKSKDYGITVAKPTEIWAVVMDQGMKPNSSFSIVALSDGNASIYVSTGGGVVGGYDHEQVRRAATDFVRLVNSQQQNLVPVTSYPLPKPDVVTFYGISDAGVRSYSESAQSLQAPSHRMNPTYYSANIVMMELRQLAERVK